MTIPEEGIEVFESDIEAALQIFCEDNNIPDLKKESQGVWNSCLLYIGKSLFKNTDRLKNKNYIFNNGISTNCNSYDIDKVNDVCDIYIYLCYLYDKEISILGFSKLTGINPNTFYEWANGNRVLSQTGNDIYKKLNTEREESLSAKLASGKGHPVAILGILNHHYGWAQPGVTKETNEKRTLTVADLPKLDEVPLVPIAEK